MTVIKYKLSTDGSLNNTMIDKYKDEKEKADGGWDGKRTLQSDFFFFTILKL